MGKNRLIIFICAGLVWFICLNSCKKEESIQAESMKKNVYKDSIIYVLPQNTLLSLEKIMKGNEVTYGNIISNSDENRYTLSFPYKGKYIINNRTKELISKSNLFLKMNDSYIPLVNETDYLFSNLIRDSINFTNDFNFCYIIVNREGLLIDGFAY